MAKVFPYEVKNSKVVGSSPGEALDSGTGSSDISAQTENANYNSAQQLQAPKAETNGFYVKLTPPRPIRPSGRPT